jgi:transcriptional regulator with XRE-family HTH domain
MRESSEVQLGQRVKSLRERQQLSLRALAARSGVSINAISRIERGETSPTVASLRRLAAALGQPIGAFFPDGPARAAAVVRRDRRLRSEGEGVVLESLATGLPDQRFEPYMLTLEPGASNLPAPVTHGGQEFLLCLQGSVICLVGEETHPLAAGDSLIYVASRPHLCRNDGRGFATLLLVHEREPQERSPHLEF